MQKPEEFFRSRAAGFYVSAVAAVLSLVAAIVYVCGYLETSYMSWAVFVLALAAMAAFVVLSLFKVTEAFAPLAMAVLDFIAFLIFIRTVYLYLSEVFFGGINMESIMNINPFFTVSLLFLLACVVLGNVGVYLKQSRSADTAQEA